MAILEQLTQSEIEFMEMFYDPRAMVENLFPENLNAPQLWDADAKCIAKGSLITMGDFTTKPIEDINIGDVLLTFGENNHEFTRSKVLNKIYSGKKEVVEISTMCGRKLLTTIDHKILAKAHSRSQWAWTETKTLLNHEIISINSIENREDYLYGQLLGLIISDGSYKEKYQGTVLIYQKTELLAVRWLLKELNIAYNEAQDKIVNRFTLFWDGKTNNGHRLMSFLFHKKEQSKSAKLGFLSGMILGDGTYYRDHGWSIIQKDGIKNDYLIQCFRELDIHYAHYKNESNKINRYTFIPLALPIYNDASVKVLKFFNFQDKKRRKTTNSLALRDNVIGLKISGETDCYDLTTEHGTFIANDILVHNCIDVRLYQVPMLNFSYMYADDDKINPKENFRKKVAAGTCFNIGSRGIGKSFLFINMDAALATIYMPGDESCIASFDAKHLKNVTSKVALLVDSHKFFKMYHMKGAKKAVSRDPHTILLSNGHLQKGVNENINDQEKCGEAFHSQHYKLLFYEESSYMSEEGTKKRVDSGHPFGHMQRLSGIPDLRIGSPLGAILTNPKNKNWIVRLPQYARADFDDETKAKLVQEYNGENSIAYKLNVLGEIIEGAMGFWDMERIRAKAYKEDRAIKTFEISKDNFHNFEQRVVIDRLPCQKCFICGDIGQGASPTEVIIVFYDGIKYKVVYNITIYKLITEEQINVFKWIYDKLGGGYIGLDATGGYGEAIAEGLLRKGIPAEHVIPVHFGSNITIDLQKDETTGRVILDRNGKPLIREENTMDFAMQRLEKFLYAGDLEVYQDEKFLKEFSGFIVRQTGLRKSYGSTTTDHLHQAYQVWGITQFLSEQKAGISNRGTTRALASCS